MKFCYTSSVAAKANTPELRAIIEKLTEETFNELNLGPNEELPSSFMTSFEHDGQTYVLIPADPDKVIVTDKNGEVQDTDDIIIVDTATMVDGGPIDVPKGHPFHGKNFTYPVPDSWKKEQDDEASSGRLSS